MQLASCAKDRLVIIWDTEGGAALHALVGHQLSAKCCSWDAAGSRLATAAADGKLLVWDGEAGTAVQELESMQGNPFLYKIWLHLVFNLHASSALDCEYGNEGLLTRCKECFSKRYKATWAECQNDFRLPF